MCLIFLVVAAIIAAIVLKITGVGDDVVKLPGPENVSPTHPFVLHAPSRFAPPLRLLRMICSMSVSAMW